MNKKTLVMLGTAMLISVLLSTYVCASNTKDNVVYLRQHGMTSMQVKQMTSHAAEFLNDIAERNQLTAEQVKSLLESYIERQGEDSMGTQGYLGKHGADYPVGVILPRKEAWIMESKSDSDWATITVNSYKAWYEDDISINYR